MKQAYVTVSRPDGGKIRGGEFTHYTIPFKDLGDFVTGIMDDEEDATIHFSVKHMTDEEFEAICEEGDV